VGSNSLSVCSISAGVVTFNTIGTCSLAPYVNGGTDYNAASGAPQTFHVGQAAPTAPMISNIPTNAVVGETFTPTVSTNGDGVTSVTTNSPVYCTISSGVVTFQRAGTCSLTSHVASGTNYLAADGTPQTFSVAPFVARTDVIFFNSEGGSAISSVTGQIGESITLPAAPTLAGSSFDGWFAASSGGSALTSPYLVLGTTTLYAQWSLSICGECQVLHLVPTAPIIRGRSGSKGSVTITETTLPLAGGLPITGYECLIRGVWRHVTVSSRHQYTLHGFVAHHRFAFRLRAMDSIGIGHPSRAITVVIR
jgi:hypothetical protein